MAWTKQDEKILDKYAKIDASDREARYKFLKEHENKLTEDSAMVWESWIAGTPVEERIRIEEKYS